ncbi:MAG: chemotaxis protein CheD [Clostridium sp.]|nr:chemotaxis protein CheD [Clostridium sp.]
MENVREIRIGIADMNMAFHPNKLITVGLGSCIGIALYDETKKIAGLAHIMLPESKQFREVTKPYKFADLAIPILVDKMIKEGARVKNIKAKIAGGASMFNFSDKSMNMDIGKRNGVSVKKVLSDLNIPVLNEDIGGNKGRTMILDTNGFVVQIRTVGMGTKEL